jgi:hypothetical protein
MDDKKYKALTKTFSKNEILDAPKGKFGKYVPHHLITKRLNEVMHDGWTFEILREIKDKNGRCSGVVARMTIDGLGFRDEIGDTNTRQDSRNTDSELIKLATSDAIKRCAMRFGIGLHLWTGDVPEEEAWSGSTAQQQPTGTESEEVETKSAPVAEQTQTPPPDSVNDTGNQLENTKQIIAYIKNTLLFTYGLDKEAEHKVIKHLVEFGKQRMLKNDVSVEQFSSGEIDTLLDKIALYFEKNGKQIITTHTDEHLSALSEAGISAEVIEEQEDEMTEIPDGKWKEDPMTEAQANFMLNTLIPECIDAGQDAIAQEAKTKVQGGELSKGQASDLITKLKESKAK